MRSTNTGFTDTSAKACQESSFFAKLFVRFWSAAGRSNVADIHLQVKTNDGTWKDEADLHLATIIDSSNDYRYHLGDISPEDHSIFLSKLLFVQRCCLDLCTCLEEGFTGIVLTGQPGIGELSHWIIIISLSPSIGKSMSLYTLLIDRLRRKEACMLQISTDTAFRFDERGAYHINLLGATDDIYMSSIKYLCLCDNELKGQDNPPHRLLTDMSHTLIQASSYKPKSWDSWRKKATRKSRILYCPDPTFSIFRELAYAFHFLANSLLINT